MRCRCGRALPPFPTEQVTEKRRKELVPGALRRRMLLVVSRCLRRLVCERLAVGRNARLLPARRSVTGFVARLPGLGGALAVLPVASTLHGRARAVSVSIPVVLCAASTVVRSRRLLGSLTLSVLTLSVAAGLVPVLLPSIRSAIPVVSAARGGGVLSSAFLSLVVALLVLGRRCVGLRAGLEPVSRLLLDAPADQPFDRGKERPVVGGHQRHRLA